MSLDKTISALQSRITHRGVEIADLEFIYQIRKSVAYTKRQYALVRAVRAEIAPMAKNQKDDRLVLRELTGKRTSQRQRD